MSGQNPKENRVNLNLKLVSKMEVGILEHTRPSDGGPCVGDKGTVIDPNNIIIKCKKCENNGVVLDIKTLKG